MINYVVLYYYKYVTANIYDGMQFETKLSKMSIEVKNAICYWGHG